jgi:hypothetical protein
MIRLKGAYALRKFVEKKWSYSTITTGTAGYVRRFRCPQCRGKAIETYSKVVDEDGISSWAVDWESPCGYVYDGLSYEGFSAVIKIEENGATVGLIDASSPPPWRRYDYSNPQGQKRILYTEFGTLWQAIHAGLDECRLLGAMQEIERRRS